MSDTNEATQGDTKKPPIPLQIVIAERLKQLAPLSASCCIYKVPKRMRRLNPTAYTPKVVSIGPLHHGKKTLQYMEEYKYRYLQDFLHSTQESLEYYIQKVRLQEAKLRAHYAKPIALSSDDFVTMILVDSAFIIELLLKIHFHKGDPGDRIMSYTDLIDDISLDLMLLENQLPLFMLEDLYDPEKACESGDSEKLSIVQHFLKFNRVRLEEIGVDYNSEVPVNSSEVEGVHFLDVIRELCLPPAKPDSVRSLVDSSEVKGVHFLDVVRVCLPPAKFSVKRRRHADKRSGCAASIPVPHRAEVESEVQSTRNTFAPSITELHRAGVKLKVQSTRNLFSILFHNGILEIPKVTISDASEITLRNLSAYEQCHYSDKRISECLGLLDSFVNTTKDVELLVKYEIVTNYLGDSSEACSLINSIRKGLYVNIKNKYFDTLYGDLHKHCKRPWNEWKASLRQNYLNSPWAIVSVGAAVFLILLTIIQTLCSVLSLLV